VVKIIRGAADKIGNLFIYFLDFWVGWGSMNVYKFWVVKEKLKLR